MSFSLHSSTENLGGGRRSWSVGSNSRMSLREPEKSSIGLMSRNASARPLSRNHWKESRCTEIKSGSGRTSSRFANENRSRVSGRDGKDYSLEDAVGKEARRPAALKTKDAEREGTATGQYTASSADAATSYTGHLVALTHQGKPARRPGQALLQFCLFPALPPSSALQ